MQIPVKVKATGEIVDVTINVAVAGNPLYTTSGGVTYSGDDIEPAEPDWQHYRIQAAIAAMQGQLANPQTFEQLVHDKGYREIRGGDKSQIIAIASVMYANALVAELKKGVNNEQN